MQSDNKAALIADAVSAMSKFLEANIPEDFGEVHPLKIEAIADGQTPGGDRVVSFAVAVIEKRNPQATYLTQA